MPKKVGIPRGLFYYQYYPLWRTFFEELGAEIIVSDHTSQKTLNDGVKSCVDEACLPVKLFHGHVINIKDRVDYLFVPRFTSISRNEYICPKFGGLPDMVRHTLKNLPQIIDTEINLRKSEKNELQAVFEIGSYFTEDKSRIRDAYVKALRNYHEYLDRIKKGDLPGDILDNKKKAAPFTGIKGLNIAVIGHVYNLYDNYSNMNMIYKLRSDGINVITVDSVDEDTINEYTRSMQKKMFWNFGRKALGSAVHFMNRDDIDGIIYLMSFGCGVDSFVCDMIERRVRRGSNKPFIVLTIDEHSGEAGMDTRLEAFTDMIRWRKKDEADIPAYG